MNLQTPEISPPPKPTAPPWGPNRSRRGFTLIELLVVIGIILVLMGLFYGGAKMITGQAKERDTRTMLETCKTMFENYRSATHLSRPPIIIPVPRASIGWCNLSGSAGHTPQQFWTLAQEDAPDIGHMPDISQNPHTYNLPTPASMDPALLNTICVMYTMESIPENKTILNNIPPGKILNVVFPTAAGVTMSVPLLLDGWGNPILFVPCGGFGLNKPNVSSGSFPYSTPGVVCLDGVNYGVVTSSGVVTSASTFISSPPPPIYIATYDAANLPPNTIIANEPFFVSAGPDGDFSNAHGRTVTSGQPLPNPDMTDDNIYSFK
jgi:prepilin-type N-terminal cleavage/methylation domain-containing protein